MSEFLSILMGSISANVFSDIFISLILITFIFSLFFAVKKKAGKVSQSFVKHAPHFMTSLGVLGTFSGIVVGLMAFDPKHIDESITFLLAGLKTAFLTSLVGMFASIAFKVALPFLDKKETVKASGENEILAVMRQQLEAMNLLLNAVSEKEISNISSQLSRINETLNSIKTDVCGTLFTLRQDVNDATRKGQSEWVIHHQENKKSYNTQLEIQKTQIEISEILWVKMNEFRDILSQSASEQVILALKTVITSFNDTFTEQFGENFKHLDASVGKLLEWQNSYAHQLEEMANKYQMGVESISTTAHTLGTICEYTKTIPKTMESLHSVMAINQTQIIDLEIRLEAFKTLRDKAIEAMPHISKQLDGLMKNIAASVSSASNHYENMFSKFKKYEEHILLDAKNHHKQMLLESKEMMETFNLEHNTANTEFARVATEQLGSMRKHIQASVTTFSTSLNETAINIGEALVSTNKNISSAADAMQNIARDISNQSEEMHAQLGVSLSLINEKVHKLIISIKEESSQTAQILMNSNEALSENTTQIQEELQNSIYGLQTRLEDVFKNIFDTQMKGITKTFEKFDEQVESAVTLTGKTVEKQVHLLDKQMQTEVGRVMDEMGEGLVTITQQFTRDYTKLTQEMNKVVHSHHQQLS